MIRKLTYIYVYLKIVKSGKKCKFTYHYARLRNLTLDYA